MTLLNVQSVSFSYDRENVLDDVSFKVEEGDFLGIIGPNGGGKSTLVKLILGLLKPKKGKIEVIGNIEKSSNSEIGYVPQNTNVNLDFPITVLDVVMMGNRQHHNTGKNIFLKLFPVIYSRFERSCATATLKQVGMEKYIDKRIGSLSGGQRQRVMIARALCAHPKLLILDEPTSSIDIEGQKQIYSLLKELNKKITIIVVSHDISVITEAANKVLYVNRKAYFHDLKDTDMQFTLPDGHFCEVEMMQMLSRSNGLQRQNSPTTGKWHIKKGANLV